MTVLGLCMGVSTKSPPRETPERIEQSSERQRQQRHRPALEPRDRGRDPAREGEARQDHKEPWKAVTLSGVMARVAGHVWC